MLAPTPTAAEAAERAAREVGAALLAARLAAGITRAAMARRLGVAEPTLHEIEHGTGNPTLARLARYADAYGLKLDVTAR